MRGFWLGGFPGHHLRAQNSSILWFFPFRGSWSSLWSPSRQEERTELTMGGYFETKPWSGTQHGFVFAETWSHGYSNRLRSPVCAPWRRRNFWRTQNSPCHSRSPCQASAEHKFILFNYRSNVTTLKTVLQN